MSAGFSEGDWSCDEMSAAAAVRNFGARVKEVGGEGLAVLV